MRYGNQKVCSAELVLPRAMSNTIYGMRHGLYSGNLQNVLVSHPRDGVSGWGLCAEGKRQVEMAILDFAELDHRTVLISSDFRRASESAEIVRKALRIKRVRFHRNLRERWFNQLDKVPNISLTREVWTKDLADPNHNYMGMESPNQIGRRVAQLIWELERRYSKRNILLVSHGDILSITAAMLLRKCPSQHSQVVRFKNAEIRRLYLAH